MAHYQFFIVPPVSFLCHFLYSLNVLGDFVHPKTQTTAACAHCTPFHSFDAIVTLDHISGLSELEPHVWHSSH